MQNALQDQSSVMEHSRSFAQFQQLPPPPGSSSDGPRLSPLGWSVPSLVPVPSSERGSAPSMGRSCVASAVIYPSDCGSFQEMNRSSESSGQSGSVLKEHDYIGLAEISSVASSGAGEEERRSECLNLEETDLRLGLGPLRESDVPPKVAPRTHDMYSSLESNKERRVEARGVDARSGTAWTGQTQATRVSQEVPKPERLIADPQRERQVSSDPQLRNGGQDPGYAFLDSCPGALQYAWQGSVVSSRECAATQVSVPGQDFEGQRPAVPSANVGSRLVVPPPKNGVKRGYSEAMAERARFSISENRPGANGVSLAASVVKNGSELQESEVNAMQKHQQASFLSSWHTSKPVIPVPWHSGLEHTPSFKPASMSILRVSNPDPASNDSPPQKGQVVGWPPVRSYRKNTLAAHPKSSGGEVDGQKSVGGQSVSPHFVKVNMDGITIGRKVDLNAHTCYEGLLIALEEMFQPSVSGQGTAGRESIPTGVKHLRLLNSSDYVLTHEDNEGDWMLVGDVPWGMFVNTVRRLRIMRGSDATGLIPRGPEKRKGHL